MTVSDIGEPSPLWIIISGRSPGPVPAAGRTSHPRISAPDHEMLSGSAVWSQCMRALRSEVRWARQAER